MLRFGLPGKVVQGETLAKSPKREGRHVDDFTPMDVAALGDDNLWCRQWWKIRQLGDHFVPVITMLVIFDFTLSFGVNNLLQFVKYNK